MKNSLELKNVHAQLDDFSLKSINLSLPKGVILGLVGRNGSGKTTLIKAINGARFVTQGNLHIQGLTYQNDEVKIRQKSATVYDICTLNPYVKGKRLLKTYRKTHPSFNETLFKSLETKLSIDLKKSINKLSLGMQKKLMLAFAFAVEPNLLLLDEPTIGIDPIDKAKIYETIQEYMENENNTVIFSSHQIEDVERISE